MDIFWRHRRRYGARRVVEELRDSGITACRRTVAKIMKNQGLLAIQPKSFKPKTTESRHRLGYNPNLLLDDFQLTRINQLWVADITYIPLEGKRFAYLAMLMDRFSRRLSRHVQASAPRPPPIFCGPVHRGRRAMRYTSRESVEQHLHPAFPQ